MARGTNQSDAVRAAGFGTKQPFQQGRLLQIREDVRDRILELKAELGEQRQEEIAEEKPTRAWLLTKYMLAVRLSEEREDRANLVKALDSIAKVEGHWVDRTETGSGPLDAYNADDLRLVIELASAVKQQRVIEAEPVKAEGPPWTADVRSSPVRAAGGEDAE